MRAANGSSAKHLVQPGVGPGRGRRSALILAAVLAISLPLAADEGNARFGIDFRAVNSPSLVNLGNIHFDVRQDLANIGRLDFWIDWSIGRDGKSVNRLGKGFVALSGFQLGKAKVGVLAGDFSRRMTNLEDRFSNSSYPDLYFRGFHAGVSAPRWSAEVFHGDLMQSEGILGNSYVSLGEKVSGVSGLFSLEKLLRLGTLFLDTRTRRTDRFQSGGNHSQVISLDGEVVVNPRLKWLGEFRFNTSSDSIGETDRGNALKTGLIFQNKRFRLEANYRDADDRFTFFERFSFTERNRKGIFALLSWRPWDRFQVFANIDRFVQKIPRPDGLPEENDGINGHAGFNYSPFQAATLSCYTNFSDYQSRPGTFLSMDFQTRSILSEFRLNLKKWNPYIRYQQFTFADHLADVNDYTQRLAALGLRANFSPALQTYLEFYLEQRQTPLGDSSRWEGKTGFSWFAGKFSIWGEAIYSLKQYSTIPGDDQALAGFIGLNAPFFFDSTLYFDLRYDRPIRAVLPWADQDRWQVTLRISKRLKWGQPTRIAGGRPGIEIRGYGAINGYLFVDTDGDGQLDPGEESLPAGIAVRLEDGTVALTDKNGRYVFSRVAPGPHMLTLEVKNIPIRYNLSGGETQKTEVKVRETSQVHFILVEGARLRGRVVLDENGDGKPSPADPGLADVLVYLDKGEINTYTDSEGYYTFDNLDPGTYSITIDPSSLLEKHEFVSPQHLSVTLRPRDDFAHYDFLIVIRKKAVIFQKLGNQRSPSGPCGEAGEQGDDRT